MQNEVVKPPVLERLLRQDSGRFAKINLNFGVGHGLGCYEFRHKLVKQAEPIVRDQCLASAVGGYPDPMVGTETARVMDRAVFA